MEDDQALTAIIAAILLAGAISNRQEKPSGCRASVALLESEKTVAIYEALDIVRLAKQPAVPPVAPHP
jgi:hypothetical protein